MWQLWAIIFTVIWFFPNSQNWAGIDFQYNTDYSPPALFENFSGPLLANRHLSKADKLFFGELHGPECFAQRNGKTYTSLADGRIVELLANTYETVVHLSPNTLSLSECRQIRNSGKCARPLGIKFDSKGTLYAVDPYHGIHKIDVDAGTSELILDIQKVKVDDGSVAIFLDDLEIVERAGKKPLFYLTDASKKWLLYDVGNVVSEADNTGRLLVFDPEAGTLKTLLSDLYFPNGLQLTDDKSAIVMCMFLERRLVKYNLKSGKMEHFVDLPGEPDNIKRSKNPDKETYWVGLYSGRNQHHQSFMLDKMVQYGGLKRFGFRLTRLIGALMAAVGKQTNWPELENVGFFTKIGGPLFEGGCKYGMVVEVDSTGKIINSLHSPDGLLCSLSEAYEYENNGEERKFYLGSFSNEYLGRLTMRKDDFQDSLSTSTPSSPSPTSSTSPPPSPTPSPTQSSQSSQSSSSKSQGQKPKSSQQQTTQKPPSKANKQQTANQGKRHQEL